MKNLRSSGKSAEQEWTKSRESAPNEKITIETWALKLMSTSKYSSSKKEIMYQLNDQ